MSGHIKIIFMAGPGGLRDTTQNMVDSDRVTPTDGGSEMCDFCSITTPYLIMSCYLFIPVQRFYCAFIKR
jgi:hypothetical protein